MNDPVPPPAKPPRRAVTQEVSALAALLGGQIPAGSETDATRPAPATPSDPTPTPTPTPADRTKTP